eukprot:scaffold40502_cov266-Skeletonema_dohrnii-CCMP3373.AAC.1
MVLDCSRVFKCLYYFYSISTIYLISPKPYRGRMSSHKANLTLLRYAAPACIRGWPAISPAKCSVSALPRNP